MGYPGEVQPCRSCEFHITIGTERLLTFRQVTAFMMDNATNNDTMVDAIERKCKEQGIPFSAKNSCLRCMPHTVHLAMLKVDLNMISSAFGSYMYAYSY